MSKNNILLAPILVLLITQSTSLITPAQMDVILTSIDSLFFVNPTKGMDIRKFVRAAFHDCMGGCDGSINLANSANRGL